MGGEWLNLPSLTVPSQTTDVIETTPLATESLAEHIATYSIL